MTEFARWMEKNWKGPRHNRNWPTKSLLTLLLFPKAGYYFKYYNHACVCR